MLGFKPATDREDGKLHQELKYFPLRGNKRVKLYLPGTVVVDVTSADRQTEFGLSLASVPLTYRRGSFGRGAAVLGTPPSHSQRGDRSITLNNATGAVFTMGDHSPIGMSSQPENAPYYLAVPADVEVVVHGQEFKLTHEAAQAGVQIKQK